MNLNSGLTSIGSEIYRGFENVLMGNGANTLIGTLGDNIMTGAAGSDTFTGAAGNDRQFGGDGNDRQFGGDGNDRLFGGDGNDRLFGGDGIAEVLAGGLGDDFFVARHAGTMIVENVGNGSADIVVAAVSFGLASDDNIETLTTIDAAATSAINLTGNALAQLIVGNAGDNRLEDGLGAADTLTGGKGNDTYVVRNAGTVIVEAAGGGTADQVLVSVSFALAANDNIKVLAITNSAGTKAIHLTGNVLRQSLTGNDGNNRLDGGAGSDSLTGANGADVFVFSTALGSSNMDTITDYSVASDRIEVDDAVFVGLTAGALGATAFSSNINGFATTASQRIIYETDTGFLWFDADGDGAAARVRFADLASGLVMAANEFLVI